MEPIRTYSADTEQELWQLVATDMAQQKELLQYSAQLTQAGQPMYFDIDIDLGGGFESGFSTTNFLAPVPGNPTLRFHLHEQDWVNEIGKVFGLEDVKLGYPELDEAFIIKTNEPETLAQLLSDDAVRTFLLKHQNAELELKQDNEEAGLILTFSKDEAILDMAELREVYRVLRELVSRISR
jgi:hypothetical protein